MQEFSQQNQVYMNNYLWNIFVNEFTNWHASKMFWGISDAQHQYSHLFHETLRRNRVWWLSRKWLIHIYH